MPVEKVFLVWNADKGLVANIRYTLTKLRGEAECALCDLTHGWLMETPRWKACKREMDVPIEGLYRDRLSQEQAGAVDGELPCVIAEAGGAFVKLLGSDDIKRAQGDIDHFAEHLCAAIAAAEAS
ncbi:MAG TPA: hypothetical protein VMR52_05140 [Dehalococcoidia bacterium]|nr:hypothetical protein [Dehalococcoidia bacterium]